MIKKTSILLVIVLGVAISAHGAGIDMRAESQEKVVLKLELPKPMFIGTPRNIRSSNLEKVPGKKRGDFYVPEGTELLSLGKPVSASDMEPIIGEVDFVTDGEKSGEDGCYVEFGPGVQYIQLDLEQACTLHAIIIWHYHSQARVYRDVIVQVSDDADFITGVQTVFNNDHDNSAGLGIGRDKEYIETNEGRLIDPRGIKARYMRLYSNGNTSNDVNHYVEVEIYGMKEK